MSQNRTNINIKSSHGVMPYLIEYDNQHYFNSDIQICNEQNNYHLILNEPLNKFNLKNLKYQGSNWIDWSSKEASTKISKISYLNLYFPEFSPEVYDINVQYAVTIYMTLNDTILYLGTYLMDRNNAIAVPTFNELGNRYNELISLPIPDPYNILYGVDWADFRGKNYTNSYLNISIHPVVREQDMYILMSGYVGSENSLAIENDLMVKYLNLDLQFELTDNKPGFKSTIKYNKNVAKDIYEYMQSIYNMNITSISYAILFNDKQDIYEIEDTQFNEQKESIEESYKFVNFDKWKSWDGFKEGINAISLVRFIGSTQTEEQCSIELYSNRIPVTQEIMKYFINPDDSWTTINIQDMEQNIINIANKKTNKVIYLNRPEDIKSNIIYPVFYTSQPSNNISIHPEVTEHICLNLDIYKSKVQSFSLKLEGVVFEEVGRTNMGIIFKIIGNQLPGKISEGIYYILNENLELITTGQYKYIK